MKIIFLLIRFYQSLKAKFWSSLLSVAYDFLSFCPNTQNQRRNASCVDNFALPHEMIKQTGSQILLWSQLQSCGWGSEVAYRVPKIDFRVTGGTFRWALHCMALVDLCSHLIPYEIRCNPIVTGFYCEIHWESVGSIQLYLCVWSSTRVKLRYHACSHITAIIWPYQEKQITFMTWDPYSIVGF